MTESLEEVESIKTVYIKNLHKNLVSWPIRTILTVCLGHAFGVLLVDRYKCNRVPHKYSYLMQTCKYANIKLK